ncbi:plasmid pRiA4b ORF-3 family protein [Thermophagus sp. OGC60D27]|uniref:plasmid pRiA4b ORF-3 family protein n=1 Tax=Thermophagus sp. OGC60D27 TaxID=3458415 RepID=UPI004037B437
MKKITPSVYQVRVELLGIDPLIWRRLQIPADLFLHDFHKVLQTTMGWENQHMHVFKKGKRMFGQGDVEWGHNTLFQDYTIVRVNDLLRKPDDEIIYHYDFGDDWCHRIILEKSLAPDPMIYYPLCIDGARECPPEDCGGPVGYQAMISAVKDPSNPQHRFFKELFPDGLDPEYFDLEQINDILLEEDYGCLLPYNEQEDEDE